MSGSHKIVSLVLDKLNYKLLPDYTYSPIYYAVYNNHKRTAKILLDRVSGINLAGTDENGSTTLHIAAAYEANEILEMLLNRGAQADFANENGETPLHKAAAHGNVLGVKILLRHGAFVNQLTAGGATPMHAVVSSCEDPDKARQVVDILAMACANLDIKDNDGHSIQDSCSTDELRAQIEKEIYFRANFPIHCMVRNGDEKTLLQWLDQVDADELSAGHEWKGRYNQGAEWCEANFTATVFTTPAEKEYFKFRLVGAGTDGRGPYTISGHWSAEDEIYIMKIYADSTVDYTGTFDWDTRMMTGTFTAGFSEGEVEFNVPFWPCTRCREMIPVQDALCLACAPESLNEEITEEWIEEKRLKLEESLNRIAEEINKCDEDGRTAIMAAAIQGYPKMLSILLPYVQRDSLDEKDNEGKTALDHALGRKLYCKRNIEKKSNDDTFECVEILCKVGNLTIDPKSIQQKLEFGKKHQFCNGDCQATVEEISLSSIAQSSNWEDVETYLRDYEISESILNKLDEHGKAILHYICENGKVDIFHYLSKQTHFKIDLATSESEYPLFIAARNNKVKMVRALLDAGVDPSILITPDHFDYQNFKKKQLGLLEDSRALSFLREKVDLKKKHPLYYIARIKNVEEAERHKNAKESAMHVAVIKQLPVTILEELIAEDLNIVNSQDSKNDTPLIIAARDGLLQHVKCLLANDAEVDSINMSGKTALICAAEKGFIEVVDALLAGLADIDIEDDDGKTVLDLVDISLARSMPKGKKITKKDLNSSNHAKIKAAIIKEDHERETSIHYREKLRKSIVDLDVLDAFNGNGFAKAINCSPVLGRTFLNDCVSMDRHNVHFQHLDVVYGTKVRGSALHSVLNMKTDDEDLIYEAKIECLEHVVMRRIMEIKWELFAQRKYLENLLVYGLLLSTMTISSILFDDNTIPNRKKGNPLDFAIVFGIVAIVFTLTSYIVVQCLRPRFFWRLARFGYDGSFEFNPKEEIEDLATIKQGSKNRLMLLTIVLTIGISLLCLAAIYLFGLKPYFMFFNNLILAGSTLYFIVTEFQEFKAAGWKYFEDSTNCTQLAVYILIVVFFVPMKLGVYGTIELAIQVGFGGFITVFLWILSLQYLEVVPNASYLLPMISKLTGDVWNFFILLAVFQVGITVTYYQIFANKNDEGFGTLAQSFYTTYFILFGNLPTDSLASFTNLSTTGEHVLYLFTVFLMMFHAAAITIILLNLLMASMNKTVDGGLERAHTEALASYAKAILRLELSMNYTEDENRFMMHLDKDVLNPIFKEAVPKSQLKVTTEQEEMIQEHLDATDVWNSKVSSLRRRFADTYDDFFNGLKHVEHFTQLSAQNVFGAEVGIIGATRGNIEMIFGQAAKCRGQQDQVMLLEKYQKLIRKAFLDMDKILHDVWTPDTENPVHARCVLVYQMTRQADLHDEIMKTWDVISGYFDYAIEEAKRAKKEEPKSSDLMNQLHEMNEKNESAELELQVMKEKLSELMELMQKLKPE
ncbi:ankyrin repeat protein [Thraustotheca clavata]|uniref:Ankyrin repeat protein n=1 Tax=Thraustotheca clavata TaxID=74557 RepID=A0A1V9ZGB6_9STRA|nr:ankyrin repeat protein [Thraustotheca clavata]